MRGSGGALRVCPQPGCNQILSVTQILSVPQPLAAWEGAGGEGECDQCLRTYCLVCSDREGRPVEAHAGAVFGTLLLCITLRSPLHKASTQSTMALAVRLCLGALCCASEAPCGRPLDHAPPT